MLADGDTPDIGDRTKSTRPHLEETEIGGSAADIGDEDMPGLHALRTRFRPQRFGVGMLFQPAVEGRLRLLQQFHAARESCLLCGCQCQLLRGDVE